MHHLLAAPIASSLISAGNSPNGEGLAAEHNHWTITAPLPRCYPLSQRSLIEALTAVSRPALCDP
jgi:hypothetical protein